MSTPSNDAIRIMQIERWLNDYRGPYSGEIMWMLRRMRDDKAKADELRGLCRQLVDGCEGNMQGVIVPHEQWNKLRNLVCDDA